jgi:hypothetical protein
MIIYTNNAQKYNFDKTLYGSVTWVRGGGGGGGCGVCV